MADWGEPFNRTFLNSNGTILAYRDALSVPIICGTIFGLYTIYCCVLIALVCCRRKNQHLRVRNPVLLILNIVAWYLALAPVLVRLFVGRWRYPCVFYSINAAFTQPLLYMPQVLRLWQIFFVHRLQAVKTVIASTMRQKQDKLFESKQQQYMYRILAFWVSPWFYLTLYLASLLVSVPFWLLLTFVGGMNIVPFADGCNLTIISTGILAAQLSIYVIVAIVFFVLMCCYRVKDRWHMILQTVISIIIQASMALLFVISEAAYYPTFYTVDRVVPTGMTTVIAAVADPFICCLIPILSTFATRKLDQQAEMGLEQVLQHDILRNTFKQFTVESLCSESLLCYEEIQTYKAMDNSNARYAYACALRKKYLKAGAPLELNIPMNGAAMKHFTTTIDACEAKKESDTHLFDKIEEHCKIDLMEPYGRYAANTAQFKQMQMQSGILKKTGVL